MKTKEREPSCLSCGKAVAVHENLMLTCAKVQKLRRALANLVSVASDGEAIRPWLPAARKALEETA